MGTRRVQCTGPTRGRCRRAPSTPPSRASTSCTRTTSSSPACRTTSWRRPVADEPYAGRTIEVPTLFVAGANEPVLDVLGPKALERMRAALTDLRGEHLVAGAGHWVQQERPDAVNDLLAGFLASL